MSAPPAPSPPPPEPDSRSTGALPHSIEAEVALLGGLMLAGTSTYDEIADQVRAADFYDSRHRLIFACLERLAERQQPYDPITVCDDLNARNELGKAGGSRYVAELAANTPSAANVKAYASIVGERALLRQLIGAAGGIIRRSQNPAGEDAKALMSAAEQSLIDIAEGRPREQGAKDIDALVTEVLEHIDELKDSADGITGIPSGFSELDSKTLGWQPGELIVVAARPGMGKTALALNMVESALLNTDQPVLLFSMEMRAEELVMRLLASLGKIPLKSLRSGTLTDAHWTRLENASNQLNGTPLLIDGTANLTPADLRLRIRRLEREHGPPGLVVVDYLQLMTTTRRAENRVQEITEISRALKQLALEFSCPLIALSQLNRAVEQRPNKRPNNSDLRESGAIEQDADLILFIYRDEYYDEDSEQKGIAEIKIGKQRNGETGMIRLQFDAEYPRFNNLAPDYQTADYDSDGPL